MELHVLGDCNADGPRLFEMTIKRVFRSVMKTYHLRPIDVFNVFKRGINLCNPPVFMN